MIVGLLSACVFATTIIPKGRSEINELIPDFASVPYDFFTLSPALTDPVLTAADVTDRDAHFVADCHMYREDNLWYMFLEVYSNVGADIGLATSNNGLQWTYRQIVLDEPFDLSYPQVFSWDGEYLWTDERLAGKETKAGKYTTAGSLVGTFAVPQVWRTDAAYYNNQLWTSGLDNYVYGMNIGGSTFVASFAAPGGSCYGVAFDGEYLWTADGNKPQYIYKVDIEVVGVAPASAGKIKALYR